MHDIRRVLLILGLIALISVLAFSQAETGTVTGQISDQSGAAIVGATVTVKNIGTGQTRTTVSNEAGTYSISNLRPDTYEIIVTSAHFASQTKRVVVSVGSKNDVPIVMAVSGGTTSVEVTADAAAQVETQSSELSQVVDSQQIASLPSLTRNPYDFVQTTGNVTSTPMAFGAARGAGVNINGARAESTNILLDGGENVNTFTAGVGQQVPMESVQEFRVITNDFSAEYGRASGGVVNVATKAGTNTFHGSVYEFNRLSALASNTADNNANGVEKSRFTRNQFGYAIGGPIVKNKLFFFDNTEWTRVRASANLLNLVPAPEFIAAAAAPTQDFFRQFGQLKPNARVLRTITQGDATLNLVQYAANSDVGGGNPQNTYSTVGRVDYNLTDKTTIFGRYARTGINFFEGVVNFSPYVGYDTGETDTNQNILLNLTHVWSNNIVSQHKIIGNRLLQNQPLGKTPAAPTLFYAGGPPSVDGQVLILPGYSALSPGNALPFGGPQNLIETVHDLSWMHGKHQFHFGGQYVYTRDNRTFGAYEEANAFFDRNGDFGNGTANFLAGTVTRFQVAVNPQGKFPCPRDINFNLVVTDGCSVTTPVAPPSFSRSYRYNDFSLYGQDTWKATNRLTLNLGLRWEYYGVQHNSNPALDSNFYFGSGTTFFDQIRNGKMDLANNHGGLWAPDRNNFAPRVGFAYDVFGDGKMAVRGGYGISYERNFGNVTFNTIQNPPAYAVVDIRSTENLPISNYSIFDSVSSSPLRPSSARAVNPNIRTAYMHMWNFAMQRELMRNTVVALEYSGSRGLKQYAIASINQSGYGCIYMTDCNEVGTDNAGANRINYQYTNINFRTNAGDSSYHALNTRLQTNNLWNTGLSFTANYTWSHAIDTLSSTFSELNQNNNLGFLDPFNPALDRGDADFDVRHRIVMSGTWDIPGYKTQTGLVGHLLGGWQLAPIFTAQTGYPFTVYDCTNSSGDASCARYIPNGGSFALAGSTSAAPTSPNTFPYLTLPGAFNYSNPLTGFGELPTCTGLLHTGCAFPTAMTGRNAFRQPGIWNLNFSIAKNIKVNERVNMQFRSELYNAFNHSNFYVQTGGPFNNGGAADVSGAAGDPYTIPGKRGSTPTTQGSLGERRFVQFGLKVSF